jgi:ureidoacrylate peracid hydrolase
MKIHIIKIIFLVLFFGSCKNKIIRKNADSTENNIDKKSPGDTSKMYENIYVKAKPDSIAINIAETAVIVVDMENDFASKGGLMDKIGDISMIQNIISPSERVLAAARNAGINIIYLKMGYNSDLSDIGSQESPNKLKQHPKARIGDTIDAPDGSRGRILIRDTWNTAIINELKPKENDIVLYKTRFSGFYNTQLDSILKQLDKKYLVVIGCTTSVCVESTVRDAMYRDYASIVLEDCVAEPIGFELSRKNHDASLLIIERLFGWVSNSGEFIKTIKLQKLNRLSQ